MTDKAMPRTSENDVASRRFARIFTLASKQAQEVLAVYLVGEKQREHRHYLKSSVHCGDCGSRLIITMTKNRRGAVYPYFVRRGRHIRPPTAPSWPRSSNG